MAEIFTTDETVSAIEAFLEWGEQEEGKSQQGYFGSNIPDSVSV